MGKVTEKDLLKIFKRNKRRLGGTPQPKGGVKGIGEAIVETLTRSVQTDDKYERSRRILEKAKRRLELITEGMRNNDYPYSAGARENETLHQSDKGAEVGGEEGLRTSNRRGTRRPSTGA